MPSWKIEVQMNRHTFIACIGRTGILRSVIVPSQIVKALGGATHIPVLARYAGETIRGTLVPAGGGERRLVLRMSALRPAGLDAAAEFDRSALSTRRMIVERLEQARTPETRERRIELIVERLAERANKRSRPPDI